MILQEKRKIERFYWDTNSEVRVKGKKYLIRGETKKVVNVRANENKTKDTIIKPIKEQFLWIKDTKTLKEIN